MNNSKKIQIGENEYIVCTNENKERYLYKYDSEYQVGIKITFCNDNTENIRDNIIQILSNQYIQKFIAS